jgi:hypothetical protein
MVLSLLVAGTLSFEPTRVVSSNNVIMQGNMLMRAWTEHHREIALVFLFHYSHHHVRTMVADLLWI